MYQKFIYLFIIILIATSCSKKEIETNIPSSSDKAVEVYNEAVIAMEEGDFFFAAKKFTESESILPNVEWAAKAALMSSYCLYTIQFNDEATSSLERFVKVYPADRNIPYARYLSIMVLYDQIVDEANDISPLNDSRDKILIYLKDFPDTEYAIDLKFKLDLISNQLAAKEMYISKFYIKTKKWIPAINRLKNIVENYENTIFIEEALHRLVEVYYTVGLEDEAKRTATVLGYNYNSSEWYEQSFKILNKDYKIKKVKKAKGEKLINRMIKKLIIKKK
jgi:outer membrane protein assembly factor BamD|tara:strand:- start:1431 stop:2264 length:834 start_codon:yes stop_codon:yes gene_type:complete